MFMDFQRPSAVNLSFLRSSKQDLPGKRRGNIASDSGEVVGHWIGHICNDSTDLVNQIHLNAETISMIESARSSIWPLAYLNWIEVSDSERNANYGSKGLRDFLRMSSAANCQIALTSIGWSDASPMEKNLHFYRKNGRKELFALDANGVPIEPYLSFHELSLNCRNRDPERKTH